MCDCVCDYAYIRVCVFRLFTVISGVLKLFGVCLVGLLVRVHIFIFYVLRQKIHRIYMYHYKLSILQVYCSCTNQQLEPQPTLHILYLHTNQNLAQRPSKQETQHAKVTTSTCAIKNAAAFTIFCHKLGTNFIYLLFIANLTHNHNLCSKRILSRQVSSAMVRAKQHVVSQSIQFYIRLATDARTDNIKHILSYMYVTSQNRKTPKDTP